LDTLPSGPVYVFDRWKRESIILFVGGFVFLGFAALFLSFGEDFSNYSDLFATLFLAFIGVGSVANGVYVVVTRRRGEFYEDFLRIIPRRGEQRDYPYGQMYLFWTETRGRGGRVYGNLGILTDGKNKKLLKIVDADLKQPNTTSFLWLRAKFGQPSQPTILDES